MTNTTGTDGTPVGKVYAVSVMRHGEDFYRLNRLYKKEIDAKEYAAFATKHYSELYTSVVYYGELVF